MVQPAPALGADTTAALSARGALGVQERAVLSVLVANQRRVVGRREISRAAGLAELSERRCDSLLVGIRRAIGSDAVVTVRSRGWMLAPSAVEAAQLLAGDPR